MVLKDAVITKWSVTQPQEKLYRIQLNVVIEDDEEGWSGINENITFDCNQGDFVSNKEKYICDKIQNMIEKYNNSKYMFNNIDLDEVVNSIEGKFKKKW